MKLINEINYTNLETGSTQTGAEWVDDQKELGFPVGDLEKLVPDEDEETALSFINNHKTDLNSWLLQNGNLLGVYANLVSGVFGEVSRPFPEKYPNDWFVEIDSADSISGNPIIFEFEYEYIDDVCAKQPIFDPSLLNDFFDIVESGEEIIKTRKNNQYNTTTLDSIKLIGD